MIVLMSYNNPIFFAFRPEEQRTGFNIIIIIRVHDVCSVNWKHQRVDKREGKTEYEVEFLTFHFMLMMNTE